MGDLMGKWDILFWIEFSQATSNHRYGACIKTGGMRGGINASGETTRNDNIILTQLTG
jgi:hypothetical protein